VALTPLDSIDPLRTAVGYGALGRGGELGYEGQRVVVGGRTYSSSLSTHPPAQLLYDLRGEHRRMTCHVALNGDVPAGVSHANFSVLADGRVVAEAIHVLAGCRSRRASGSTAMRYGSNRHSTPCHRPLPRRPSPIRSNVRTSP
jgi:NPCBM/NEW2 domain-containing protein